MSAPATLFFIYFGIGMVLCIFAVALPGREKRTKAFSEGASGTPFDAGLLVFVALLWPIWVISLLGKGPKE